MESLLTSVITFLIAIAILVTVHEFGHFWVARRCGIKVLRFSVGFGRPLLRWQRPGDETEYVVAAIPLGGYVKMLDEREGDVPAEDAPRAFNRQSLRARAAVVVAGPAFNFVFAILVFWLVLMIGELGQRPLVGSVEQGAPAAAAGLAPGDEILAVNRQATPVWTEVLYQLAAASFSGEPITLTVRTADGEQRQRTLAAGALGDLAEEQSALKVLGLTPQRPAYPAVLGELLPDQPAALAGMLPGDRVLAADGQPIELWSEWVDYVKARPGERIEVEVARGSEQRLLFLEPAPVATDAGVVGRIGAYYGGDEALDTDHQVLRRLDPLAAMPAAVVRTWDLATLTLEVMGRIVIGEASIKNLSGPITIADAAGKTAQSGLVDYLKFLALVSISLGVINLLPIPMLDGGHLVYLAIEGLKGGPPSEEFLAFTQRIGLVLILGLMSVAFYVDLSRLLG